METYVREPKQARSRASFDRALTAAVDLLVTTGPGFTLADVARESGVSIGAIYGRIDSKEALLRAAHAREMDRLTVQTRAAFAAAEAAGGLAEVCATAIAALADLLQREAKLLSGFIALGRDDATIASAGSAAYETMRAGFVDLILKAHDEIEHPDPPDAAAWACEVAYSVLDRRLGIGGNPVAHDADPDLASATRTLTTIVVNYLAPGRAR